MGIFDTDQSGGGLGSLLQMILGQGQAGPQAPMPPPAPQPAPQGDDPATAMASGGVPMPMPRPPGTPPGRAPLSVPLSPPDPPQPMGPGGDAGGGAGGGGLLSMIMGGGSPNPNPSPNPSPNPTPGAGPNMGAQIMRALAGGMSKIGSSPFKGQAFGNAFGGAIQGGNAYEDSEAARASKAKDQALKQQEADQLNQFRQGSLGVSKQNADTQESYRSDQVNRGQLLPGTGKDENGNDVPGAYVFNPTSKETEFRPGVTLTGKPGAGGRDTAFQQRLRVGNALYGDGTKEAADYAGGIKRPGDAEINQRAAAAAQRDLAANSRMQNAPQDKKDAFLKQRIDFWKEQHRSAPSSAPQPAAAPPAASTAAPPPPSAPAKPAIPAVGEVRQGYRFKGGNPGDQGNWEQVQ